MHKKIFDILAAIIIFAFFILSSQPSAFADEADIGHALKGYIGHKNPIIDRSLYTDASLYDNPSVSEQVMRIGLDFGSEAVGWASFENLGGGGFIVGHYDENRVFHAERQTKAHFIYLNILETEGPIQSDGKPEMIYTMQFVNGINSAVLFSMDESIDKIAIISADGSQIKYKNDSYHGGFECILNDNLFTVINYVDLENYVKGVIPYEMSSYWPFEALRAQAVCARTYAIYNVDSYKEFGFDLTDDTRSQVYRGTVDSDETTDEAVDSTNGQIVRYKGEACELYYFSSDGGATEDGTNVFSVNKPYLAGKTDPFEDAVDFTLRSWTLSKTGEDISKILNRAGHSIGVITDIRPSISRSGNVVALQFYDAEENCVSIDGRRCYTILGLHNCNFRIEKNADTFTFVGSGWGHNCGMSQWGAYAMADVYGYNYDDIIRFYFTGAYIA